MASPSDTAVTSTFPYVVLSPVATSTTQPTYQSIHQAQRELNANAASVYSSAGGGLHGHLALTITPAAYQLLAGVPFDVPPVPPAVPVMPPQATAAQIAEGIRLHADNSKIFHRYHDLDKSLLRQLIAATPAFYTEALNNADYGFTNVTCLQMLTHLKTEYGKISIAERDANQARMSAPWHPPTPIESLFKQLTEGMRLAAAGDEPLVDSQVARIGYNIMQRTGVFNEACRDWRLKAAAGQTFLEFKSHFRRMDADRLEAITSQSAGYHGSVHHVDTEIAPPPVPPTLSLPEALAELALYKAAANAASQITPAPVPHHPKGYCWTHGSSRNIEHTSLTCNKKGPGHRDDATFANKLGGSTNVWKYQHRRDT